MMTAFVTFSSHSTKVKLIIQKFKFKSLSGGLNDHDFLTIWPGVMVKWSIIFDHDHDQNFRGQMVEIGHF